ncbi:TPA: hypothetical protein L3V69_000276 [Vibrio parahaemolyticus]|uniref:Uncharacterized protein n=4 Tax=Vibrio TaxID=662 RepID=A0A2R9VUB4_VIBPH|nr:MULTISPECIES: hypothetical protein [Vibrio]HAS6399271.1 hypothetical protein [Vibrio vulnificus]ANZ12650.1 hypothetical protein VpaChn25_A1065 [Vibrio parahaemolyticus]APX08971.1 hypothetical protein BWP24_22675 [Vibrio campbellii]ARR08818.1 hypothetical protein Vc3S01_A0845 [Vibrio campbellii]ATI47980.1 hypothetical protein CO725_21065 [Vibrio parahaemolyticus]
MTLTEKQEAAIEIFNSRNNIRGLELSLGELEAIRDRVSHVIDELNTAQEVKAVEAAIHALQVIDFEIPHELEKKYKILTGSKSSTATKRKPAPLVKFKVGEDVFKERSQGKASRELAAAIERYNSENGTKLTKKDFKTDEIVEDDNL